MQLTFKNVFLLCVHHRSTSFAFISSTFVERGRSVLRRKHVPNATAIVTKAVEEVVEVEEVAAAQRRARVLLPKNHLRNLLPKRRKQSQKVPLSRRRARRKENLRPKAQSG